MATNGEEGFDAAAEAGAWLEEARAGLSDGVLLEQSTAGAASLSLRLLEGSTITCHLTAAGAARTDDGRAGSSLHELLMAASPAYGRWYLATVAERLRAHRCLAGEECCSPEGEAAEGCDGQRGQEAHSDAGAGTTACMRRTG
jgi:hypothetical protein